MADSSSPRNQTPADAARLAGVVLAVLVGAAYFPSIFCGFIWDDDVGIVENENLRSTAGLVRIWTEPENTPQGHYWPLVDVSFWLEFRLWGLNPFGYHLTNILLQIANTLLVWRLLARLEVPAAWFAAALFGVHPIQVESVAWIIERKNLLSGIFFFASIHAYLTHRKTGSRRAFAGSLACAVLGMLSKSSVFSLPFVLVVLTYWKTPAFRLGDYVPILPFFVLCGAIAWWDVSLVQQREVVEHGLTLTDRFVISGRAFWFYLFKVAFPADLVAVYPRWETGGYSAAEFLWPVSVLILGLILLRLARRGSKAPLTVYLIYGVCLGPTLGFVDFGFMALSFVADRFAYLAVVPVFALVSGVGAGWIERSENRTFWRRLCGAILVAMVLLSARQCTVYKDQETLVRHNLERRPEAWLVRYNYAVDLAALGRIEEAVEQYRRVLETNPDAHDARNNLGALYARMGELDAAKREFLRVLDRDPSQGRAHRNLGAVYSREGDWSSAAGHFQEALEADPENEELREILKNLPDGGATTR